MIKVQNLTKQFGPKTAVSRRQVRRQYEKIERGESRAAAIRFSSDGERLSRVMGSGVC